MAEMQPQNHQNVKETQFWQKVPGVNGLNEVSLHTIFSRLKYERHQNRACKMSKPRVHRCQFSLVLRAH